MVFSSQAYQFLTRLYKEYSLAGGGPNSPAQEPTKACSSALCCMVVVVPRVQLKHRVDPLGLIECLNLFCVLPDIPQDLVSRFALLVTQGKVHTIWPPLRFMEKIYSFTLGNQREPDMLPTLEKRSVWQMAYNANRPAREYPAIPRHRGVRGVPSLSLG